MSPRFYYVDKGDNKVQIIVHILAAAFSCTVLMTNASLCLAAHADTGTNLIKFIYYM
jgi:hypothetical protein